MISDIWLAANVKQLQEEIFIVWVAISLEATEKEIADLSKMSAARPPHFALANNASEDAQEAALLFLKDEEAHLLELKALLASGSRADAGDSAARLDELIRQADYLYLHFPDYANERSLDAPRQDFLNRARMELDFFLKTVRAALRQAGR